MKFKMYHENYNVLDLDKSLEFYEKALGLKPVRRIEAEDGSYIIVFVGNDTTDFQLELTWIRDREEPYNLGDEEFTLHSTRITMKLLISFTKKWVASALKTKKWAFTSSRTQMDTG